MLALFRENNPARVGRGLEPKKDADARAIQVLPHLLRMQRGLRYALPPGFFFSPPSPPSNSLVEIVRLRWPHHPKCRLYYGHMDYSSKLSIQIETGGKDG